MIFGRNENGTFSILPRYENHINHEWSESYLLTCKPEIEPVYESCSCHFCVDTYPRMNSILDALPTQELKDSFNTLMSEMQSDQLDLEAAKTKLDGEWPGSEWIKEARQIYDNKQNREVFEERVFSRYFQSRIVNKDTEQFSSLLPETLNKAQLLRRSSVDNEDYEDENVSAMWFGWTLALSSIALGRMK